MVDAVDSKSTPSNRVMVRVRSSAMIYKIFFVCLLSFVTLQAERSSKDTIYIYAGPGTLKNYLLQTAAAMNAYSANYTIEYILPEQLIADNWEAKAALLVIPGGADIPYTKALNGIGNQKIRSYVENGGSFLGICAGSYYGGAFVDFAKGTIIEVQGDRELSFFPGVVRGPILAPFDYQTESGARAAKIFWKDTVTVFYNGGGYFVDASSKPQISVLATYDRQGEKAAIIECQVGLGKAILSGVHFEYDPNYLDASDEYLQHIIPDLQSENSKRIQLLQYLLNRLNVH